VVRYVVHGILHLMGYDDLQPLARKKMKREEGRLVRELSRRFALSKL
jgi:ssRNA-specific RNase YbeY (16S rRNA maturation enzyme)